MSLAAFSFPISVVLLPLGLFAAFYAIYALFNLRNLFLAGKLGLGVTFVVLVFMAGSAALFGGTAYLLSGYDLNAPVEFSNVGKLFVLPTPKTPSL